MIMNLIMGLCNLIYVGNGIFGVLDGRIIFIVNLNEKYCDRKYWIIIGILFLIYVFILFMFIVIICDFIYL